MSKAAEAGIRSPNARHCLRPSQWLGHLKSQVCKKAPKVQPIDRKCKAYFWKKEKERERERSGDRVYDIGPYSEALWLDHQTPSMNEIMPRSNCVWTQVWQCKECRRAGSTSSCHPTQSLCFLSLWWCTSICNSPPSKSTSPHPLVLLSSFVFLTLTCLLAFMLLTNLITKSLCSPLLSLIHKVLDPVSALNNLETKETERGGVE